MSSSSSSSSSWSFLLLLLLSLSLYLSPYKQGGRSDDVKGSQREEDIADDDNALVVVLGVVVVDIGLTPSPYGTHRREQVR